MRSLMVLIDGLGDEPIAKLNGKTPFEYATHLNIDKIAAQGMLSAISICEDDIIPESSSCILRLLGVSKKDMPQSRSYLELLANGRDISEYEMVLRCNLVAVDTSGKMVGFNGYGLSPEMMEKAANLCNDIFAKVEFIHLSEYRNLIIMDKEASVLSCEIPPPHEHVGENVQELLSEVLQKSLVLKCFLDKAETKLKEFAHDGIHYMLYPWGSAGRHIMPSFNQLHHKSGAAVCKAEIVHGIAKALKMQVCVPEKATGDVDTDIEAKLTAALKLLQDNDFVIAHFNGSDEASHRYDYAEKIRFIEHIDSCFLGKLAAGCNEPLKIIICGDHITSSVTGKHGRGQVPVVAGYLDYQTSEKIKLTTYHDIIKFLMGESD